MLNIGFMASHGGSGMKAVLEAVGTRLDIAPKVLICNNKNAEALNVAKQQGLAVCYLSAKTHADPAQLDQAIADALRAHQVDLVLLSGYMKKLGPATLSAFKNRILNIHPALLPRYGGKGMYGGRVHQAVIQNGERQSGASVHIVTAEYDQGPVLKQCKVAVSASETWQSLRDKVKNIEGELYVETLAAIIAGEIVLP